MYKAVIKFNNGKEYEINSNGLDDLKEVCCIFSFSRLDTAFVEVYQHINTTKEFKLIAHIKRGKYYDA